MVAKEEETQTAMGSMSHYVLASSPSPFLCK